MNKSTYMVTLHVKLGLGGPSYGAQPMTKEFTTVNVAYTAL